METYDIHALIYDDICIISICRVLVDTCSMYFDMLFG